MSEQKLHDAPASKTNVAATQANIGSLNADSDPAPAAAPASKLVLTAEIDAALAEGEKHD